MKEKLCPFCGAAIPKDVHVCPVCGRALPEPRHMIKCSVCGAKVSDELEVCPVCGAKLKDSGPGWLTKLGYAAVVAIVGLTILLYGKGALNAATSLRSKAKSALSRGIIYIPTPSGFVAAAQATPTQESGKTIATPTVMPTSTPTTAVPPTQTPSLLPPTPTFTPTQSPTSAPTAAPTPTATATPTPKPTPTRSPTPTRKPRKPKPSPTPTSTPTTVAYKYQAPVPFEPKDGSRYSGKNAMIKLRWKFDRPLAPDERFQIPITFTKNGQKQTWKLESGANYLVVPRDLYGQADAPESLYRWSVLVVKAEGSKRTPLSPASEAWTFHWYR